MVMYKALKQFSISFAILLYICQRLLVQLFTFVTLFSCFIILLSCCIGCVFDLLSHVYQLSSDDLTVTVNLTTIKSSPVVCSLGTVV